MGVDLGSTTWLRRWGWATLLGNAVLVVTGGAVRLTGSGLGCPTWPRCTDESYTPHGAVSMHSAIEFGNRTLTFVLAAIAIGTFISAWQSGRPELRKLAFLLGLSIPAQAVIGGITVLTDLNPWVVSFHLLISLALICLAALFIRRVSIPIEPRAHGPVALLGWLTFISAWVVLYIGTVVTGSGPHAGDAKVPRNGLDPLQLSQLHADAVFLFIGLTIGLVVTFKLAGAGPKAMRAVFALVAAELLQAAIGFVQYFTDLPILLVGLHMLGAAVITGVVAWVLLEARALSSAEDRSPSYV